MDENSFLIPPSLPSHLFHPEHKPPYGDFAKILRDAFKHPSDAPRSSAAIQKALEINNQATAAIVLNLLSGSTFFEAAKMAGVTPAAAKSVYDAFEVAVKAELSKSAKSFLETTNPETHPAVPPDTYENEAENQTFGPREPVHRLILSEEDFCGLISRIVSKGNADLILEWMSFAPNDPKFGQDSNDEAGTQLHKKFLGFGKFKLSIPRFVCSNGSVEIAAIQLWRPSGVFGSKENHRVLNLLKQTLAPRYPEEVPYKSGKSADLGDWFGWGGESLVSYERQSSGQTDSNLTDIRNDFIVFQFHRNFREAGI